MLWVYGQYKYFYSYSAGVDFSCQNLTTNVYPRAVRVMLVLLLSIVKHSINPAKANLQTKIVKYF